MGSGQMEIDVDKIAEIQQATLDQAVLRAKEVRDSFISANEGKNFQHIEQLLNLIVRSMDLAFEQLKTNPLLKTGSDYYHAKTALDDLDRQIKVYVKDPKQENYQKISATAGHIVDRVSQKVLDISGRDSLNAFYDTLAKEQRKLLSLYESLNLSALALKSFTKIQVDNALHTQFSNQLDKTRKSARIWLGIASISSIVLIGIAVCAVTTFPIFLAGLSVPEYGSNIFIILASAPRLLITAILFFVAFSSWKVFHTYKHLEVGLQKKESAAKLIPMLVLGEESKTKAEIKQSFLRHVLEAEETGFIAQVKSTSNPILENIKS